MNYDFKTKEEFRDFIIDALQSGRYNQEIQNLTKGINTTSNSNNSWDWIEERKLYVATNKADTLYIIFTIANQEIKQWLQKYNNLRALLQAPSPLAVMYALYIPLYKKGEDWRDESLGVNNQFTYSAGSVHLVEMKDESWIKEYILLDSHSSGFINWKKNPWGDLK